MGRDDHHKPNSSPSELNQLSQTGTPPCGNVEKKTVFFGKARPKAGQFPLVGLP